MFDELSEVHLLSNQLRYVCLCSQYGICMLVCAAKFLEVLIYLWKLSNALVLLLLLFKRDKRWADQNRASALDSLKFDAQHCTELNISLVSCCYPLFTNHDL